MNSRTIVLYIGFICLAFVQKQQPPVFPLQTDRKLVGLIYQMLKVTDSLFTEHGIPYWIDGGTALGAQRHQGMIPWDDDADLIYPIEYEHLVLALGSEFAKYGFYLEKQTIFRLFPSKEKRYPFIDIAGYVLCSDNTLRFASEPERLLFSNFYWLPEEVNPLIRVKFGPLELPAPNHMMRYLTTGYGIDCMTLASFQRAHGGHRKKPPKGKFRITSYAPAKYEIENLQIPLD